MRTLAKKYTDIIPNDLTTNSQTGEFSKIRNKSLQYTSSIIGPCNKTLAKADIANQLINLDKKLNRLKPSKRSNDMRITNGDK